MKERIEEMANDIAQICPDLVENCCGQVNCVTHLTLSLYNAGYRKQIEGEWEIVLGSNGKEKMVCTNCRHQQDLASTFTYCPNCGANMKDGAE